MPKVPALSRDASLKDAVAHAFADAGALARALPDFEARPAQLEMAAAVAQTLEDGGVLLAEAGTGTGKTLAYLVPAILSRQRVLVSTGTKNLQEQIYFKDLPVLRDSLGVPFTAAYMKGRGNYLCLHRYEAYREGPAFRSDRDERHLQTIDEWLQHTDTGDRAEVDDLPEDLPFWPEISATAENCLGAECPRYNDCFIVRMRQRAAEADVVIVNHHLLCADAALRQHAFGEVIPSCRFAIVDEAHQLEDVATQYFGLSVSNYRIDDFVRDVERALGAKLVADAEHADAMRRSVELVRDYGRTFFNSLQMLRYELPGGGGSEARLRITSHHLLQLADTGTALIGGLEAVMIRIQLAGPNGRFVTADTYNQLFTMHGTTMVFLVIMPMSAAFFNFLIPLQIGARDVAFPRLNAFSYWVYLFGATFINASWLVGAAPDGGWCARSLTGSRASCSTPAPTSPPGGTAARSSCAAISPACSASPRNTCRTT